jgi:hypothetical protein
MGLMRIVVVFYFFVLSFGVEGRRKAAVEGGGYMIPSECLYASNHPCPLNLLFTG